MRDGELRRRAVTVLCVGLVAGLAAGTPASAAAAARPAAAPFRGIQDVEALDNSANRADVFRQFAELRTSVVRLDLRWDAVAAHRPARARNPDDPAYDWLALDERLSLAQQYGLGVHLTIYRSPRWARPRLRRGVDAPPTRPGDYGDFVEATARHLATRFPGLLRIVEVWSEPNGALYFGDQRANGGAPRVYAGLVSQASAALRRTKNPDGVLLAAGALQPTGRDDRGTTSPLTFLAHMRLGPRGHRRVPRFDLLSVHAYPLAKPGKARKSKLAGRDADLGRLGSFARKVDRMFGPTKLYVSEFGWLTTYNVFARFAIPLGSQGRAMRIALAQLRAIPQVVGVVQYQLRDQPAAYNPGGQTSWQSGLQTFGGRAKPGLSVFRDAYSRVPATAPRPIDLEVEPDPGAPADADPRTVVSPNGDGHDDAPISLLATFRRPTYSSLDVSRADGTVVATLLEPAVRSALERVRFDPAALGLGDGVYRLRLRVLGAPGPDGLPVERFERLLFVRVDTTAPVPSLILGPRLASGRVPVRLVVPEQGTYAVDALDPTTGAVIASLLVRSFVKDPQRMRLRVLATIPPGAAFVVRVRSEDAYGNVADQFGVTGP